jgi:hypothetical protein
MHPDALCQIGTVAYSRTASSAIFAFSAAVDFPSRLLNRVSPKIPVRPSLMTRPYRRRAVTEAAQYPNFNGVPVLVDTPFPYVTGPGLIATLTPTRDIESGADQFAAGFTSAMAFDQVAHSNPWAPDGAFRMDGGGLIYNGGLAPGGYFVQPQFKTLDGAVVSNHRMLVTVAG